MPIIIYGETIYDNLLRMGYSRILRDKKYHLCNGFVSYFEVPKSYVRKRNFFNL